MAASLPGDLNGDGQVDAADEAILTTFYGASSGDLNYEPAADLNADGVINHQDLGSFGGGFGSTGGDVDTTPPDLVTTLNDIPDNMNDLLVAPPDAFEITLLLDSAGGSAVDTSSLQVVPLQPFGPHPAFVNLVGQFQLAPTRAVWEVPAGTDLDRANYWFFVLVRDFAGNGAIEIYGFAVRDFPFGPPLQNLQTFHVDFDSGFPSRDFTDDLREYGLSSALEPIIETLMRDRLITQTIERMNLLSGLDASGSPGPDPVNVQFVTTPPGGAHSRICVGGAHVSSGSTAGAAALDVNNIDEAEDDCGAANQFGVFPQAFDNLWDGEAEYDATFYPIDPDEGGVPVGEDPLDPIVTAPGFDPYSATSQELARYNVIENAVNGFAQALAVVTAHEIGHMLGLVAHEATPGGLYGGESGANTDHNVTPGGQVPSTNWVMNSGGSFSFEEIVGRGGFAVPAFRPLNWAYLRDRITLNLAVTGLFPPPVVTSVVPNPTSFPQGQQSVTITINGSDFLATPIVQILPNSTGNALPLNNVIWLDSSTLTAELNKFAHPPDTYDVEVTNPDLQVFLLDDGLTIQ